jgi:6-phosphogluconolactonase
VAERFLPALARAPLGSADLDVFWVDERAVPADDPASNYGLARRLWLDPAGIGGDRVHPMTPGDGALDAAVRASERELLGALGAPPALDVALLGVGEDGHVASLFPGHPALLETGWVSAVSDAPKPPPRRITLTLAALLLARRVAIGAFGQAKARVVAEALCDDRSPLPLARVLRGARECVLFLDPAAASALEA